MTYFFISDVLALNTYVIFTLDTEKFFLGMKIGFRTLKLKIPWKKK